MWVTFKQSKNLSNILTNLAVSDAASPTIIGSALDTLSLSTCKKFYKVCCNLLEYNTMFLPSNLHAVGKNYNKCYTVFATDNIIQTSHDIHCLIYNFLERFPAHVLTCAAKSTRILEKLVR